MKIIDFTEYADNWEKNNRECWSENINWKELIAIGYTHCIRGIYLSIIGKQGAAMQVGLISKYKE